MKTKVDVRRVVVYLAFAFAVAWAGGLVLYLAGGLASPLALPILAIWYMGAPALAHVLTRVFSREGWSNVWLRPRIRRGWPYWAICWIAPGIFVFIGMAVYFLVFPRQYDPSLGVVRRMMAAAVASGQNVPPMDPWVIVAIQTVQAFIIAPAINAIPTLGEEFGWRAYLLPKLLPLGPRKALLVSGVIWGVWHWPVIAMGHNYGLSYPGAPWLGMLAMVWFTVVLGTLLGWATLRAGSVWPAVIGHGAINGIAGVAAFFMAGPPTVLLGPAATGLIGSVASTVAALLIYLVPGALRTPETEAAG